MNVIIRVDDSQTRLQVGVLWNEWIYNSDVRERVVNTCIGNRQETQSCFQMDYTSFEAL